MRRRFGIGKWSVSQAAVQQGKYYMGNLTPESRLHIPAPRLKGGPGREHGRLLLCSHGTQVAL